jgi:hypothetical protein
VKQAVRATPRVMHDGKCWRIVTPILQKGISTVTELVSSIVSYVDSVPLRSAIAEKYTLLQGDIYSAAISRLVKTSIFSLAKDIAEIHRDSNIRFYTSINCIVSAKDDSFFIVIQDANNINGTNGPYSEVPRQINIEMFGSYTDVEEIYKKLDSYLVETTDASLTWYYLNSKRDISTAFLPVSEPNKVYDEFYPILNGGVDAYLDKYMSSSLVLLMLGPPGTGKTSLIRHFIWKYSLSAMFTYDEDLLRMDDLFVNFLTGRQEVLVVEDADLFLKKRESDGNNMMAKFLNAGDGLASNKKKKIIFTANIVNDSHIDEALLRPGRCFDCLRFRPLTYEETTKAGKAANIAIPDKQKSYTLAELFAQAHGDPKVVANRTGF